MWIRINALDGHGVNNENVTAFKYALVECDDLSLAKQNEAIRKLQLPVATLTYRRTQKAFTLLLRLMQPMRKNIGSVSNFYIRSAKRMGYHRHGQ